MTADYRGRRPAQRPSNVLSPRLSRKKAPDWPLGEGAAAELALWCDLWTRPVAGLWRSMHTPPVVVGRYVRVLLANPASGSLAQMESALGLTPASLRRLQITFEDAAAPAGNDDVTALLDAAVARWEARK
jgi:hypothetical protein